jgi:peptide-methionine (R)-S-oxide reductase
MREEKNIPRIPYRFTRLHRINHSPSFEGKKANSKQMRWTYFSWLLMCIPLGCSQAQTLDENDAADSIQWEEELSPEAYRVLRQCGTEQPFTGEYWDHHERGIYLCAGCGAPLFNSETKYDSGSGWPSFFDVLNTSNITTKSDDQTGVVRTELLCSSCGGHLGHVFSDGPEPHGLRYCINSTSRKRLFCSTGNKPQRITPQSNAADYSRHSFGR